MARPFLALAAALALSCSAVPAAYSQSPLSARLANDRLGVIRSGTYQAGDDTSFTLTPSGDNYLLRFSDSPEVYVLYAYHASMGGRVLKYDFGKTAMQIAGWGGITLYTQKHPGGIPAVRTGNAAPPHRVDVSLAQLIQAASDESTHLAYTRHIKLGFDSNWNRLSSDAELRALCFDAMENAARGLDLFAAQSAGHRAVARHIETVLMRTSGKPTIRLDHKTLIVTYNPDTGYIGRASSRAIALALHKLFRLPETNE